jgi:hypothetical protein
VTSPSHEPAFSHSAATALASSQSALPVCLRLNLPPSVPRDVDQATASLPASTAFFKFARAGIFRVAAFAFDSVTAIELERHTHLT